MLIPLALAGCISAPTWSGPANMPAPMTYGNPIFAPYPDAQYVFDATVDIVGDYFRIEHEEPVRMLGTVLTEGRIDTYPKIGATIFEPWDSDSANGYERWESTLQSIHRRAVVKVTPAQGGYWIEVVILKELENCVQPEQSTAGKATFPYDDTFTRVVNPAGGRDLNRGWILQGRDPALEQRILGQLADRLHLPPAAR